MMSEILEKFGIYDLLAVLLSGICITTMSLFIAQVVFEKETTLELIVNESLLFLVLSYLTGLIFQEIGSLIQKEFIFKNNKLLKNSLETSDDSYTKLTKTEKI